jgi:hypothetical protein
MSPTEHFLSAIGTGAFADHLLAELKLEGSRAACNSSSLSETNISDLNGSTTWARFD